MIKYNKRIGAKFESDVVKTLRANKQFIYRKGVSTKGIDVLAFKEEKVLQIELKATTKLDKTFQNKSVKQYIDNDSYISDFIECFGKYHNIILYYYLIIFDRNENVLYCYENDNIVYEKYFKRKNIIKNLNSMFKDIGII